MALVPLARAFERLHALLLLYLPRLWMARTRAFALRLLPQRVLYYLLYYQLYYAPRLWIARRRSLSSLILSAVSRSLACSAA